MLLLINSWTLSEHAQLAKNGLIHLMKKSSVPNNVGSELYIIDKLHDYKMVDNHSIVE